MRTLRRIFLLAAVVAVVAVLRERLLASDEARTGLGQGFPPP